MNKAQELHLIDEERLALFHTIDIARERLRELNVLRLNIITED